MAGEGPVSDAVSDGKDIRQHGQAACLTKVSAHHAMPSWTMLFVKVLFY